jgi:zinc finger protein
MSSQYLQNPYAPDADPNMAIELYDRTYDQNEFLGLNDMVLEGYEEKEEEERKRKEQEEKLQA